MSGSGGRRGLGADIDVARLGGGASISTMTGDDTLGLHTQLKTSFGND